jgi:hypothetical protein
VTARFTQQASCLANTLRIRDEKRSSGPGHESSAALAQHGTSAAAKWGGHAAAIDSRLSTPQRFIRDGRTGCSRLHNGAGKPRIGVRARFWPLAVEQN